MLVAAYNQLRVLRVDFAQNPLLEDKVRLLDEVDNLMGICEELILAECEDDLFAAERLVA